MLPWCCVDESAYVRPALVSLDAPAEVRRLGASDDVGVEPDTRADPPRVRPPVAERYGNHPVRHPRDDPDRKLHGAARVLDTDDVLVRQTERVRRSPDSQVRGCPT